MNSRRSASRRSVAVGPEAGVGERGLRLRFDGRGHAAGALEFGEADRGRAGVLAHQPLQHEGEQRQRVRLALDLGLQALDDGGIEHRRRPDRPCGAEFRPARG